MHVIDSLMQEFLKDFRVVRESKNSLRLDKKEGSHHTCSITLREDNWFDCTIYRSSNTGISNTHWTVEKVIEFVKEKF